MLLGMSLCVGCATGVVSKGQDPNLSGLKSALHDMAKANPASELSGYALRVFARGQRVYSHDAGYAGAGFASRIQENTVFELASLSKIFTALAVMQLQERGLINLHSPVKQYLQGLPQAWHSMTVHHLLTHQSGLPDVMNLWSRRRINGLDFQVLMAYFEQNTRLQFEPGTRAAYSNTNYIFLAELIAQVSGQDFEDYLKRHVFEPAGMLSSSVKPDRSMPAAQQTLPYAEPARMHEGEYALLGAINQKSSVKDLENFLTALLQHKLVRADTLDAMMVPYVVFEDGKRYGYGWYIGQLGGWAAMSSTEPAAGVGHTGRLGAYRSAVYFNRKRDFQFIMLSNGGVRTEKLLVDFLGKTRAALE